MNSALKNLIVAATAGFVILAAAAFAISPTLANDYDDAATGNSAPPTILVWTNSDIST